MSSQQMDKPLKNIKIISLCPGQRRVGQSPCLQPKVVCECRSRLDSELLPPHPPTEHSLERNLGIIFWKCNFLINPRSSCPSVGRSVGLSALFPKLLIDVVKKAYSIHSHVRILIYKQNLWSKKKLIHYGDMTTFGMVSAIFFLVLKTQFEFGFEFSALPRIKGQIHGEVSRPFFESTIAQN